MHCLRAITIKWRPRLTNCKASERPTSDIVILIPFIAKKLAIPPDTQMDLPYRVFNFYVNEVMKIDGYFSKL